MIRILPFILMLSIVSSTCTNKTPHSKNEYAVNIDFSRKYQSVDGFGVNINPAMWHKGKLKPAIDFLVDDLGATLFRFDCFGQSNWLDPSKRDSSGRYTKKYLNQIYTSAIFRDAWETFRYLNNKGIKPLFNISGAIPNKLAGKINGRSKYLADFEGYAEMMVTMLLWARENEHLQFDLIEPFNETDLAQAEGPKIPDENCPLAIKAIEDKLKEYQISDIRIIVMGDFEPNPKRINLILTGQYSYIYGFSHHSYGNGMDEDGNQDSFKQYVSNIKSSNYPDARIWLSEYGDLDQTNDYEYGVSWNSTRRLMTVLSLGYNAGIVWDAFDNYHAHDSAWSTYGLIKIDTSTHKIELKNRYYAAKQIYRYVKPGFFITDTQFPPKDSTDVYRYFNSGSRLIRLLSFISPEGNDFTITGMNKSDEPINLDINLNGLPQKTLTKDLKTFQTNKKDLCKFMGNSKIHLNHLKFMAPPRSIFTITTLEQ